VKRSVHPLQSWSELEVQDGEEVPPRCLEVDLMYKTETWSFTHTALYLRWWIDGESATTNAHNGQKELVSGKTVDNQSVWPRTLWPQVSPSLSLLPPHPPWQFCSLLPLYRATEAFQKVLELAPNFARVNEIHLRLGVMCKMKGANSTGLQHFQKALSIPGPSSLSKFESKSVCLSVCLCVSMCVL